MSSPLVRTDAFGRIVSVSGQKSLADIQARTADLRSGAIAAPDSTVSDEPDFGAVPVGGSIVANIDVTGDQDFYTVNLTAGQTYLFSMRGTGGTPLFDSLFGLFDANFNLINIDDDGGNGTYSLITYTATATGTYVLGAAAFDNGDDGTGEYTINVLQQGVDSVGATNATSVAIGLGTTFGFRETGTDIDRYSIQLEAGKVYSFSLAGGADYNTDPNAVPTGELDTILRLRNSAGTLLSSNDDVSFPTDLSSSLTFIAQSSGTYYLDVTAYTPQTGGYALDVKAQDLSDFDPLDSLIWDRAANVPFVDVNGVETAYVYFAPAGVNFGELADDGVTPMTTLGWQQYEIDAVMNALGEFEKILGVNYEITTDVNQATFRLMTTESEDYGAYFYPQDPSYGTQQGIGVFNVLSGGWTLPQSLEKGGYSYAVILHEFGHAHGLSHPHDRGGGSDIMLGVTGSASLGVFNLNQGVYTVMSYNDAWQLHPDGPSSFSLNGIDNGWSATLSAFDIAALQQRYGVTEYATGNDTYTLTDVTDDAFYQTIWDSAGNDTIAYNGALNAQIDLTAATLDYSATGGGVVSFVYNLPTTTPASAEVKGGFTIAGNVVIENATGGSGNDTLIGNAAANVLTGNNGNDILLGRGGNDHILGGAGVDRVLGGDGLDVIRLGTGNDTFVAELGAKVATKAGSWSYDVIVDFDGAGSDDVIDLSSLGQSFNWRGTNSTKNAGDLSYKTYASINGAEKALGIEIDGNAGAGGVGGPVTVVFGNTDGGSADFAIVLLNTSSVDQSDFIFSAPAAASSLASQSSMLSGGFTDDYYGAKFAPLYERSMYEGGADYLIP